MDLEVTEEERPCMRKNGREAVAGMFHSHWILPVKLNQNKFNANSVKVHYINNLNMKEENYTISRENNVIGTQE